MPSIVRAWLMVLGISNMMIPMLLIRHMEAGIMLLCTVPGFMIGVQLHKRKGMTRILGLMHLPWLPAVFFLVNALIARETCDLYGLWMVMAIVSINVSQACRRPQQPGSNLGDSRDVSGVGRPLLQPEPHRALAVEKTQQAGPKGIAPVLPSRKEPVLAKACFPEDVP